MPKRAVTTSLWFRVVLVSKLLNHHEGATTDEMVALSAVGSGSLSEKGGSRARDVMLPPKGPLVPPVQKVVSSSLKTWQERGRGTVPEAATEMLEGVSCGVGEGSRATRGLRCGGVLVVAEPSLVDCEIKRLGVELQNSPDLVQVRTSDSCLALAVQCLWTIHAREHSSTRGRVAGMIVCDDHKGVSGLEISRNLPEVDLGGRHLPRGCSRLGCAAFCIVAKGPWEIRGGDCNGGKQRCLDKQGLCGSTGRCRRALIRRAAKRDSRTVSSAVSTGREFDAGLKQISIYKEKGPGREAEAGVPTACSELRRCRTMFR